MSTTRTRPAAPPLTLRIDDWHPATLNQLLRNRWHAARLKRGDKDLVTGLGRTIPRATGKRRVRLTITLVKGQRAPDPDAYWKSLLDALVHAKLLVDDNRQHVELEPVRFVRGARRSTLIELEDLEERT